MYQASYNNYNNNNNGTHFLVLENRMNFLSLTEPNPIGSLRNGKVSQQIDAEKCD
jgi:hypothetical protein